MKNIFLLYMPGHAGNFLNRLISLSPETMPQVSVKQLHDFIHHGIVPGLSDRLSMHSFRNAKQYASWRQFHSDCVSFYNKHEIRYLVDYLEEKFEYMVYCIHPEEFKQMKNEIDRESQPVFCYVELDKKYQPWVEYYREKLDFRDRADELNLHDRFKEDYQMSPIYLGKMLDSMSGFEEEYLRVIREIGLTPVLDQARVLFDEWLDLRGPKKIYHYIKTKTTVDQE